MIRPLSVHVELFVGWKMIISYYMGQQEHDPVILVGQYDLSVCQKDYT